MSVVGITRSSYDQIYEKIGLAIERGGGLDIRDGAKIAMKINLCDYRTPETGAVTHPVFLDATLRYLRSSFRRLRISVVESNATAARPDLLVRWLGIEPILVKHRVKWVNLSRDEVIEKGIDGRHFRKLEVPRTIEDSDYLVTVAKLKTHLLTKISCSLKNQFGCIPIPRKVRFHPVLDDVIVDSCLAMKPDFCLVDGILGMGGIKGPVRGVPIKAGVVITGKDPVAVDTVCAMIMGFHPHFVAHIRKAQASGIGRMSHELVGERISDVRKRFEYEQVYAWLTRRVMSLRRGY